MQIESKLILINVTIMGIILIIGYFVSKMGNEN